jgi:hypothetical protein
MPWVHEKFLKITRCTELVEVSLSFVLLEIFRKALTPDPILSSIAFSTNKVQVKSIHYEFRSKR